MGARARAAAGTREREGEARGAQTETAPLARGGEDVRAPRFVRRGAEETCRR